MSSRIEQLIDEIDEFIDRLQVSAFVCNKDRCK